MTKYPRSELKRSRHFSQQFLKVKRELKKKERKKKRKSFVVHCLVLKHENLTSFIQVVAHQAVSLQWLSYMLLRCILSCNMLEKNTVLTLIFFYVNQKNK